MDGGENHTEKISWGLGNCRTWTWIYDTDSRLRYIRDCLKADEWGCPDRISGGIGRHGIDGNQLWKDGQSVSAGWFSLHIRPGNDGTSFRIPCRMGFVIGLFTAAYGQCFDYQNLYGVIISECVGLDLGYLLRRARYGH